jgi:hypothetical protein
MTSRVKRVFVAVALVATLGLTSMVLAVPASARVAAPNTKFCQILSSDQGAGINFDGLGTAEAKYAAKLNRTLAKTGVPAKLKRDLEKLAKIYDRIADGVAANTVIASEQKFITKVLTEFSTYVRENCTASVPSTT